MDKEVSIVLSREVSDYRKLAQQWYGLSNEQMIGMDVHHNPARHEGGRNIPEHLFVYHFTLHSAVHGNDFTQWAREASLRAMEARKILLETDDEFKERCIQNGLNLSRILREKRKDPVYEEDYLKIMRNGMKKTHEILREKRKDPEYEEEYLKMKTEIMRKATKVKQEKRKDPNYRDPVKKPVVCTNIDTGEVRVFASVTEASIAFGLNFRTISNVALGRRTRAGRWRVRFQGKT